MGQLVFQAALGGQVNLVGPNTASTLNINVPAFAGTMSSLASVTANGVEYVNSSGQPTSGSSFVFDGTNVGIGTASPAAKFNVKVASGATTYLDSNTSRVIVGDVSGVPYIQGLAQSGSNTGLAFYNGNAEVMRYDTSGNVGIGTASPATNLAVVGTTGLNVKYGAGLGLLLNQVSSAGAVYINQQANDALIFATNNAERMRIDSSGNLLVNATSVFVNAKSNVAFDQGSGTGFAVKNTNATASGQMIVFYNSGNTLQGSISQVNSTTVSYNTTSDYRLKTVIGSVSGAGGRIDALEPIEYEWKESGLRTRGFLAHKFQEVYSSSVTGTKDKVDADGKPVYQGMQASSAEVIADLVAEIQSLRKRITALEAK